jgi:hypothetical protein
MRHNALYESWPGLSRPSTPYFVKRKQDVDARDKRGHDVAGFVLTN